MRSPKDVEAKLNKITNAWQTLAADKSFGGMTLAQFKADVKPSFDSRERLRVLDEQTQSEQITRETADDESMRLAQLVTNGVLGDPEAGPDSDLYEAMGYVRTSARKSGLTRKRKTPPTA